MHKHKTIKKAIKNTNSDCYLMEYNEFPGRYLVHQTEYDLQSYIEKLLQQKNISSNDIEVLLDLHFDTIAYTYNIDICGE